MSEQKIDKKRRNLVVATCAAGGVASAAAAVPFVASMWPSERAKAAGAPIEADISKLQPGELGIYEWRGKPVWILRRTKEMLDSLKGIEDKVERPGVRRARAACVREKRHTFDQARVPGGGRHLHASRLLADREA